MPNKQYKYWIDGQDLYQMLQSAYRLVLALEEQKNNETSQLITVGLGNSQQQQQQPRIINTNASSAASSKINKLATYNKIINDQIADGDQETINLITFVETRSKEKIEDILQLSQGMKKMYFVENQKIITSVYQQKLNEETNAALSSMVQKFGQYQSKFKNKTLRLCFSSQSEIFSIFHKIFGPELFSTQTGRKLLQELWESFRMFRSTMSVLPQSWMCHYYFFKITLFCKGRELFDSAKIEYPLHKAVFENNLPLISRLINCTHDGVFFANKNELDMCGNSPLNLAVKLGYVDAVKVLSDLFTCPKLKSLQNYPCAMDIASGTKNKDILKILLETNQKIKQHYLDMHKDAIFRALESLPDFKIDLHFKCKSNFIPFVRNITPSDTYRIYKQGSKIRLDMTLIGFRKLKCIRGNLSVLFKGRGQENEGELFVVDHDTKSVQNLFNDIAQAKIDKDLDDILHEQQYQKLYKAERFKIDAELDKKGEIIEKTIEGHRAEKYQVKTTFSMTKYQINLSEVHSLQKYKSYEDYQENSQKDIFGINDTLANKEQLSKEGGSGSNSSAAPSNGFNWNIFSSTAQNVNEIRIDTEQDHIQMLTQGNIVKEHHSNTNINNTIMGYAANKKTTKKTINASIWICQNHPLSLNSFFPLLHVLSFSSKQIAKFKDYLDKYELPKGSFPLKAKVPLFLTMKVAFSLQNLSFDTSNFNGKLFTIDEEYTKQRAAGINQGIQYSVKGGGNLMQFMNQNSIGLNPKQATRTLNKIYKLCKTDEDYEDEEEDSESLERANELFNSMMKKQVNQSEELLLEMSSFHSEYDSLDLSEKHMNDESFKLGTHAFSQVQTMDQINVRHDDDDEVNVAMDQRQMMLLSQTKTKRQLQEYKNAQNRHKSRLANSKSKLALVNQTTDNENPFDRVAIDDKQNVNKTSAKLSVAKAQKPPTNSNSNNVYQYQVVNNAAINVNMINLSNKFINVSVNGKPNQDQVKTLKKNFQPRNLKNYKNMIKYGCNQDSIMEGVTGQGSTSADPNVNTPQISTADTSVLTNKISSFFASQSQLNKQQNQNQWFRQMVNNKNGMQTGGGGVQYLQTIESEEILGTDGPDNFSQIGNQTIGANNSAVVTQSNFDDAFSRKSFIQSFSKINNPNNMNSSRESSLKSFNSGNASSHHHQIRHTQGSQNNMYPPNNAYSDGVNPNRLSQSGVNNNNNNNNGGNINKEERKALVNHNTLISSIHNYVNQQNFQSFNVGGNSITPQKAKMHQAQIITPQPQQSAKLGNNSAMKTIEDTSSNTNSTSTNKQAKQMPFGQAQNSNNSNKSLLPPKVSHKRQSSYGGSGSASTMNGYVANVTASGNSNTIVHNNTPNAQPQIQIQKQQEQVKDPVTSKSQASDNTPSSAGGGILSKIFGASFSRTSANLMTAKQPKTNDADISSSHNNIFGLNQNQNIVVGLGPSGKDKLTNVVFQTFDNITTTKNRPISNTHYMQSPPPLFAQMKLEGAPSKNGGAPMSNSSKGAALQPSMKKTNDVDIFLPYQF